MPLSLISLIPLVFALASGSAIPTPSQAEIAEADRQDEQYRVEYTKQFGRIERALRESSLPRDWALAAQLYKPQSTGWTTAEEKAKGQLLRRAADAAPNDRFVQWAWANASVAMSGCNAQHPCPDRAAALAILEPDNAAAWMPVVHEAFQRKDARETDMALSRMAAATRYDDLFVESVLAWSDVYRRFPVALPGQPESPANVFVRAAAVAAAMAMPSVAAMRACDRSKVVDAPPSRFEDCRRIGRTMLYGATTMIGRQFGRGFLRTSGNLTAADADSLRAMDWLSFHHSRLWMAYQANADFPQAYAADMASTGSEIEAARLQLQRAGIGLEPPAGWKANYER